MDVEGKWTKNVTIGKPLERLVGQLRDLVEPLAKLQARSLTGLERVTGTARDTPGPERSEGENKSRE